MSSPDALDLLRQSIATSTPPKLLTAISETTDSLSTATHLSFSTSTSTATEPINIPKETPTRYTSKAGTSKEFYTIGQLWLAYAERESGVREYLIKVQAAAVGNVAITDRRGVVEFLLGESEGTGRVLPKGEDREFHFFPFRVAGRYNSQVMMGAE